jgi:putative Holliday junction resolvase
VETEKPAAIVVGLPLDSDDNETAMSLEIRNFFANLEKTLSLPVYYIDESLTSKHAAVLLQHRRKKDRQDKAAVDRIAACLILDSFLGEQAPGSHPDL